MTGQQRMMAERIIPDEQDEQAAREPRLRTLKQGFAGWTELHAVVECIVRDMSESGAKLEFKDVGTLPSAFELTVPVDGTIRPCKIVWSRANFVGVEFTGPARISKKHKRDQVLSAYRVDENKIVSRQPQATQTQQPPDPQPFRPVARPRRQAFGKLGK
ncbi:MAG: PilZ domain-containing protein [Pseudomonadota bacterium]